MKLSNLQPGNTYNVNVQHSGETLPCPSCGEATAASMTIGSEPVEDFVCSACVKEGVESTHVDDGKELLNSVDLGSLLRILDIADETHAGHVAQFRAQLRAASHSRDAMAVVMATTLRALGYDVSAWDGKQWTAVGYTPQLCSKCQVKL